MAGFAGSFTASGQGRGENEMQKDSIAFMENVAHWDYVQNKVEWNRDKTQFSVYSNARYPQPGQSACVIDVFRDNGDRLVSPADQPVSRENICSYEENNTRYSLSTTRHYGDDNPKIPISYQYVVESHSGIATICRTQQRDLHTAKSFMNDQANEAKKGNVKDVMKNAGFNQNIPHVLIRPKPVQPVRNLGLLLLR